MATKKKKLTLSTTQTILISFVLLIVVGSGLLSLPIAAADGVAVPYIDALFTAATATSCSCYFFNHLACVVSFFNNVIS